MSYATIDGLRSQLGGGHSAADDPVYAAKMLHKLPAAKTVDRAKFILDHCRGKRVLEFGASGPLHDEIRKVALGVVGVDRESVSSPDGTGSVIGFDLDDVEARHLPDVPVTPEVIVCGEVLEHLGNPLWFLTRLRAKYVGVPTIITVPNAFTAAGRSWLAKGYENVNKDHVAWYSPKTISVLLERAGYTVGELFYYNGDGPTAEGLVVVTE